MCELSLIDKDLGEFDFGVEIFGVGFEDLVENELLFWEILFVLIESQENVQNFEIVGFIDEF